jgi:hypothetical protein
VEKYYSNSQYFKEKKLQNEIFNQFNIRKVKMTKIILEKKTKKKVVKNKKTIKKYIINYCYDP